MNSNGGCLPTVLAASREKSMLLGGFPRLEHGENSLSVWTVNLTDERCYQTHACGCVRLCVWSTVMFACADSNLADSTFRCSEGKDFERAFKHFLQ